MYYESPGKCRTLNKVCAYNSHHESLKKYVLSFLACDMSEAQASSTNHIFETLRCQKGFKSTKSHNFPHFARMSHNSLNTSVTFSLTVLVAWVIDSVIFPLTCSCHKFPQTARWVSSQIGSVELRYTLD